MADKRQLETILVNIRKISGVLGVERVYQPGHYNVTSSRFSPRGIQHRKNFLPPLDPSPCRAHLSFRRVSRTAHFLSFPVAPDTMKVCGINLFSSVCSSSSR